MTRRRDERGRFTRSEFGPIASGVVESAFTEWEGVGVPPFSSGEDAHSAAWDRDTYQRAQLNERRNRSEALVKPRAREAFALLDGTPEGRAAALGVLTWATWERCQIEGLEDRPTIRVAFR